MLQPPPPPPPPRGSLDDDDDDAAGSLDDDIRVIEFEIESPNVEVNVDVESPAQMHELEKEARSHQEKRQQVRLDTVVYLDVDVDESDDPLSPESPGVNIELIIDLDCFIDKSESAATLINVGGRSRGGAEGLDADEGAPEVRLTECCELVCRTLTCDNQCQVNPCLGLISYVQCFLCFGCSSLARACFGDGGEGTCMRFADNLTYAWGDWLTRLHQNYPKSFFHGRLFVCVCESGFGVVFTISYLVADNAQRTFRTTHLSPTPMLVTAFVSTLTSFGVLSVRLAVLRPMMAQIGWTYRSLGAIQNHDLAGRNLLVEKALAIIALVCGNVPQVALLVTVAFVLDKTSTTIALSLVASIVSSICNLHDSNKTLWDPQLRVLNSFFDMTGGGSHWKRRRNWKTHARLDEWFGVGINAAGKVNSLMLDDNKVHGNVCVLFSVGRLC